MGIDTEILPENKWRVALRSRGLARLSGSRRPVIFLLDDDLIGGHPYWFWEHLHRFNGC